mgnify:CR=1 FL=1
MKEEKHSVFIADDDLVTVTEMNHIVEVQHMRKMNRQAHIKKLDKDRYVDLQTGEIKEFKHIENRSDSYNSLRQTFKKLRYLINANFEGKPNELHVILTYKENMTDTKRLYSDFDKFMKRLRYKYRNESSIDYISVVEPQERGAWHSHLLLRFNDLEKIYIPNEELASLWEQGFTKTKSLKNVDNIGAYLSAYLTDVELTDENVIKAISDKTAIKIVQVEGQQKKFIKGGRLHLYPPGMNLFRKSRGIVYPERQRMKHKEVKKVVGSAKPTYSKSIEIEKNDFQNTITYEQYNLKR